jgi:hypothetical protein
MEKTIESITGIASAMSSKWNDKLKQETGSICVDGTWYNGKSKALIEGVAKGDKVTVNYSINGTFKNLEGNVAVLEKGAGGSQPSYIGAASNKQSYPTKGMPELDRQRLILRQNALTNAVNFVNKDDATVEEVLRVAAKFEAYTSGDADKDKTEDSPNWEEAASQLKAAS